MGMSRVTGGRSHAGAFEVFHVQLVAEVSDHVVGPRRLTTWSGGMTAGRPYPPRGGVRHPNIRCRTGSSLGVTRSHPCCLCCHHIHRLKWDRFTFRVSISKRPSQNPTGSSGTRPPHAAQDATKQAGTCSLSHAGNQVQVINKDRW